MRNFGFTQLALLASIAWSVEVSADDAWYAVHPPVHADRTKELLLAAGDVAEEERRNMAAFMLDDAAPIDKWVQMMAFDTAAECEAYRVKLAEEEKAGQATAAHVGVSDGWLTRMLGYRDLEAQRFAKCISGNDFYR